MKRGTPDHPKTQALQAALGCPRYAAVGILESLWHFTALYAYQGDVGKFPDGQIEKWMGWDGEPGKLVAALLACRWLDAVDDGRRLMVHDWRDHCEVAVQKRFMRDQDKAKCPDKSGQVGKCLDMSRHVRPALGLLPSAPCHEPVENSVENTNPPTPFAGGAAGSGATVKESLSLGLPVDGAPPTEPPPGKTPQKRAAKAPAAEPTIPPALDTPEFREAWETYWTCRKGGRGKPELHVARMKECQEWGVARAVAALKKSVGYQGLWEPNGLPASGGARPPAPGARPAGQEYA